MNDRADRDRDDGGGEARSTDLWQVYTSTAPPPISTQTPPALTNKPKNIREFKKGEYIRSLSSDDPNAFFVIQLGTVHAYITDADGNPIELLETLTGGDVIVLDPVNPFIGATIRYQASDNLVTIKVISTTDAEPDSNTPSQHVQQRLTHLAITRLSKQHRRLAERYVAEKSAQKQTQPILIQKEAGQRQITPSAFNAAETARYTAARADFENLLFDMFKDHLTDANRDLLRKGLDEMSPRWHLERAPTVEFKLDLDLGDLNLPEKPPVSVCVKHDVAPPTQPATPIAQQAARTSAAPRTTTPVPPSSTAPATSGRYSIVRTATRTNRPTLPSADVAPAAPRSQLLPSSPPVKIPPPPKPIMRAEEPEEDAPCKTEVYDKGFFNANAPRISG